LSALNHFTVPWATCFSC